MQVPELNVQNGVLKALSFLFEYIGEMGKDYIYAVSPLLEDALMDRDLVSWPTSALVHFQECCLLAFNGIMSDRHHNSCMSAGRGILSMMSSSQPPVGSHQCSTAAGAPLPSSNPCTRSD